MSLAQVVFYQEIFAASIKSVTFDCMVKHVVEVLHLKPRLM